MNSVPRAGKKYTFGILTSRAKDIFRSQYHRAVIAGIFDEVSRSGHALKFMIYEDKAYSGIPEVIRSCAVDGLFVIAWRWIHPRLVRLISEAEGSVPLVIFNDYEPVLKTNVLYADVRAGIQQAVDYLCQKGHRKIGMLRGPRSIQFKNESGKKISIPFQDAEEKVQGFREAVHRKGLLAADDFIRECSAYSSDEGYRKMKRWLKESKRPEAVVCGNDDLAIGAFQAIREAGLSAPENVALIGFDDTEKASLLSTPLTTVAQPLVQMGRDGVGILIRKIKLRSTAAVQKRYPCRLIARSTA